MIRYFLLVLSIPCFVFPGIAQVTGDLCTNPYTITLQDPLAATCDFVEIPGLDFTNFNDNTFSPSPSCSYGSNNNDIWVKLTIPANADGFKITMDSSVITSIDNDYENFKVAVYSGSSCGSLTYKTCKSSSRARVYNNYFDGFNSGDVLYVRIYTDNNPSGTWDKPFFARFTSISTAQSNDACSKASVLIPGTYCNHLATDKGENDTKAPDKLTSTTSVCAPGNVEFGSFDNNQWYSFAVTATTPQPVEITISNVNCSAGDKILQAAIWKATTLNCGTWGNGYDLNTPASASEGDLLACAVGTGVITLSEHLPLGKYWYTVDGSAGSFCEYTITQAPAVVVPIRLLQFSGQLEKNGTLLNWSCMEPELFSTFIIEKSYDGVHFIQESSLVVEETQSGISDFSYLSSNSEPLYYRIRIVAPNGEWYFSAIIFTGYSVDSETSFAASYAGQELTLVYKGQEKIKVNAQLSSTTASEIKRWEELELWPGVTKISLAGLQVSDGIYFLQIVSDQELSTFKLVLEN